MGFDFAKYQSEFVKKTYRQFNVKVRREDEQDMIEWLESKESIQAYIRDLIRQDMEKSKNSSRT